ncbi:MAG: folylpolyglutamate synthase/dihydrofolate synthase family protein [Acidobacteriota bacterium]
MQDPLIDWLFQLQGPSLKWDIETVRAFAARLGHPERGFRSVHLAGTNGKGSVAAMLHGIARASGLSVGLNTSPHLVDPEERIRIDDHDIQPTQFRALISELRHDAEQAGSELPRHPSFFEMITLAAMRAFERAKVDLAVVETGLGGRLDATNILTPTLSVITTIGIDHLTALGGSLDSIASEKAGIVKPGVPVLAGWMHESMLSIIQDRAQRWGAPFYPAMRELSISGNLDGSFDLITPVCTYRRLRAPLAGPHQRLNTALAVRAAELLRLRGLSLPEVAIQPGLDLTRWPGRMEQIAGQPHWLLDGAHNADGADALGRALRERYRENPCRRVLIFGLSEGRDAVRLCEPLLPSVERVIVTQPVTVRAQSASLVASALRGSTRLPVDLAPTVSDAMSMARRCVDADAEIVVCGSLYLVGDVRRLLLGVEGTGQPLHERVPPIESAVSRQPHAP